MFEPYVICDDGFENVAKDGKIIGFQLKTRIAYYRGVPLSMVDEIELKADDIPNESKRIRFSIGDETCTLRDGDRHLHQMGVRSKGDHLCRSARWFE